MGCVCVLEPPVAPGFSPVETPIINLPLKSGALLVPSQSCQLAGMELNVPDHMIIEPAGSDSSGALPGAGTALPTVVPDIELVGKSLPTRFVHSRGTTVETVKALLVEEIV